MNLLNTPTYSLIPARVMLVLMSGLAVAYAVLLSIGGWDAGMAGGLALVLAMAAEANNSAIKLFIFFHLIINNFKSN